MKYDLALDNEFDFDIYNKTDAITGNKKVVQQAKMILALQKGAWFYNTDIGLLMMEYVLGVKDPDYQIFFAQVQKELEKIEGVKQAQVTEYKTKDEVLYFSVKLTMEDDTTETITASSNKTV